MKEQPIFIIGAPRSGTTFLASLLEPSHYGAPFETHFITKYFKKLETYGDINTVKNLSSLLNDISKERAVMQWKLELNAQAIIDEIGVSITYPDIVNYICLKASNKAGNTLWGDKTPHYIGDMEIILELFPNAKYIYIVRDGRDVALSLLKKVWGPNNIYYCARHWRDLNNKDLTLMKLEQGNQLFRIRYEELIDKPKSISQKLYQFLRLDIETTRTEAITSSTIKGNYGKWQQSLTEHQIKIFEKTAGNTLIKFGYPTTWKESNIPFITKAYYYFHNAAFRVRHLFIINIVDGFKIRFLNKSPFAE
jgi:hypothetical protein